MPAKKKQLGIESLLNEKVWASTKYEERREEAILVSIGDPFIGLLDKGRVFYFHKDIFTAITKALPEGDGPVE